MTDRVTRSLALAVVCVVLAVLAGCGSSDDGGDAGTSASTGATGAATEVSGTLTVWDPNYDAYPGYTRAADQLDAEFERLHPDVRIDHVAQPFARYDQILQASFTGREGPDVMMVVPGAQGVLRWTRGLEQLDDRVSDEMRERLTGWNALTPTFRDDGDTYAVPVGLQGEVFYYNKELFRRAGLPTDFQPETWDDVRAAAERLRAAGIQPFVGGNREGFENQWWFSSGWQTTNSQEDAIALAEGDTPFTGDEVARALEVHKTLQDAGLFEENRFSTPLFPDGAARFGAGDGAMFLGLWSTAAYYGEYNERLGEENVGVFLPPGSSYVGVAPGWAWAIPSYSENKDAAWAYIDFLTSAESNETLYRVGGVLPNHADVELSADAAPQERFLVEATRTNDTFPDVHQMIPGTVLTALSTEINEVLQGRKSLEEAQQSLQDTADRG